MEVINKSSRVIRADAEKDIDLINQYALKELTADEVFCFSVVLCDNDIDRDYERFTDDSLTALAKLFVGKTGITDHERRAGNQIARLYRCAVQNAESTTKDGEQLKQLVGSAYMVRNEATQPLIEAISAGIMREVSISCAVSKAGCSICGSAFHYSWDDNNFKCEGNHSLGKKYDGKTCVRELSKPLDAYEFSFVAVPAQRGAGVTKAFSNDDLIVKISAAELSADEITRIMLICCGKQQSAESKANRERILAENEKFLH